MYRRLFLLLCPLHLSAALVVSIRPLAFIASAIAHEVTDVVVLLPPGASPHHHTLSAKALAQLREAELFFWIGPGMEQFLVAPVATLHPDRVTALGEHCALLPTTRGFDWHIWLSPLLAETMARHLCLQLTARFPEKSAQLEKNLSAFIEQLHQTLLQCRRTLEPVRDVPYVVLHNAYRYFTQTFDLQPPQTLQPHDDHALTAQQLLQVAGARKLLFCEAATPPSVIKKLESLSMHVVPLDPLGEAIERSPESYFQLLETLATTMASALLAHQ